VYVPSLLDKLRQDLKFFQLVNLNPMNESTKTDPIGKEETHIL